MLRSITLPHLFRRGFHVSVFAFCPWIYYSYFSSLSSQLGLPGYSLLYLTLMFVVLLEGVRLKLKCLVWGMRSYEAHQISALAWGATAVTLVLRMSPSAGYAYGLCWVCALVDPLIGELKRFMRESCVYSVALVISSIVWYCCHLWFQLPLWLVFILPVVAVGSEYPSFKWVDDNFLMAAVPLLVILLVDVFGFL